MSRFQCIPGNLAMGEHVSHGQRWTYASDHPMEEMLGSGYFMAQRTMLRPGDTLRIIELRSKDLNASGNRVLSYIDMMIVETGDNLTLRPEAPLTQIPTVIDDDTGRTPEQWATERYIKGDGKVKWNNKRQNYEVFEGLAVVAEVKDKDEAWRIAKGEDPLPVEAEAA